ncbi:MAG: MBL fold metallo-hydrolase [Anaerolineae bacterium]|nr:MBL fold metallo-hydrolase [Anaerolineae bacterium]
MELYPGFHLIHAPFEGNRYINLVLLRGETSLLVDSGVAGVPQKVILPYFKAWGIHPTELKLLINLHAHADHIGGNGELRAATQGQLKIGAHELDAPAIANHLICAHEIYGLEDESHIQTLLRRCGQETPVELVFKGGEILPLGEFEIQIIHAPGHTKGNLSLYERRRHLLIHGESIMGPSRANAKGKRNTPFGPDPSIYRGTLLRLQKIPFEGLISSHQPPKSRKEGLILIQQSLTALDEFESMCRQVLQKGAKSPQEMAQTVSQEGNYELSKLLLTQASNLLANWVASGQVVHSKGRYQLA